MPDWKKIVNPWGDLPKEDYNCIMCSPYNPKGLHLSFYEDGDYVLTRWIPTKDYEGWTGVLHGGIQATLIDEVTGWTVLRKLQTSGVTTRMNVKYKKPVPSRGTMPIEVRCKVAEVKRSFAILNAELLVGGEVYTEAELTFYCFPKEKAVSEYRFSGCKTEDEINNE